MPVAAIAFFDVDKTLLSVNSASLWLRKELREGRVTAWQAARAGLWLALYGAGLMHADDVIRTAVRTLKGKRERDVIERTLQFFHDEVKPTFRPGALQAVDRHKQRGDLCFLLTGSSAYMSAAVADTLSLDGFLSNRFLTHEGVFTGEADEPVCFGEGKVAHATECARKLNVSLAECAFYTDSASDLPMLLLVGTPVAVNPDVRLRREAKRRGWPIEDWGVPATRALPPHR